MKNVNAGAAAVVVNLFEEQIGHDAAKMIKERRLCHAHRWRRLFKSGLT